MMLQHRLHTSSYPEDGISDPICHELRNQDTGPSSRFAETSAGPALAAALVATIVFTAPLVAKTGLPLPRFASLRAAEVNVRTGPGVRYPVEWVFVRRRMPVQITAEFGTWRRIKGWQGTIGWVHQSMLSGRRSVIITGAVRPLHLRPEKDSRVTARVDPSVVGRLLTCKGVWCRVEIVGIRGWLRRDQFFGVIPGEKLN